MPKRRTTSMHRGLEQLVGKMLMGIDGEGCRGPAASDKEGKRWVRA